MSWKAFQLFMFCPFPMFPPVNSRASNLLFLNFSVSQNNFFNRVKATGGDQSKLCPNLQAAGPSSHRHHAVAIHKAAFPGTFTRWIPGGAILVCVLFHWGRCVDKLMCLLGCDMMISHRSQFYTILAPFYTVAFDASNLFLERQQNSTKQWQWSILGVFSPRKRKRKIIII